MFSVHVGHCNAIYAEFISCVGISPILKYGIGYFYFSVRASFMLVSRKINKPFTQNERYYYYYADAVIYAQIEHSPNTVL